MTIRTRRSARVILLGPEDRVLLFLIEDFAVADPRLPPEAATRWFWLTPGGGLEAGETFAEAAARELWEETGIGDAVFGPLLLEQDRVEQGRVGPIRAHEQHFLARTAQTEISVANLLADERSTYRGHRWWRLAEVDATDEIVFPEELAALIRRVLGPG